MLRTRLLTAAVGIPLVAAAVWVGDVLLAAVVAVAVAVATLEFANARGVMRSPLSLLSGGAAAALPAAAYFGEAYLLGAIQLRSLRKDLVDTGLMTNKAFHDEILRLGSQPMNMLRLTLNRQKLTRDMSIDWKFYGELPQTSASR